MQKTDRFLLGFVLGALLLVALVLVLAVRRPPPEYQPEDKPENVALNYLLALQRADYPRAYAALSPALRHYPASAAEFAHLITINRWMWPGGAGGSSMLRVTDTRRVDASAFVTVRETLLLSQGLFGSQQQTNGTAGVPRWRHGGAEGGGGPLEAGDRLHSGRGVRAFGDIARSHHQSAGPRRIQRRDRPADTVDRGRNSRRWWQGDAGR